MAPPGLGWERGDHRGGWGGEEREGTGRSTPERHRHHARAGPRWRRDSEGGSRGRAFSPGAEKHRGHGSPHTLSLDYPEHLEIGNRPPLPRPPSRRRRRRPRAPPSPRPRPHPSPAFLARGYPSGQQKPARVTVALTLERDLRPL